MKTETAEAADLLSGLQTMNLNNERPLWEILGLAIPVDTLGPDMQGSAMHQTLLAAYDKLFATDR